MRIPDTVDLILFDLDGLLVDTEQLHWRAYQEMCRAFGSTLSWDFPTYLRISGSASHAIAARMQVELPQTLLYWGRLGSVHGWRLVLVSRLRVHVRVGLSLGLDALPLRKLDVSPWNGLDVAARRMEYLEYRTALCGYDAGQFPSARAPTAGTVRPVVVGRSASFSALSASHMVLRADRRAWRFHAVRSRISIN